MLLLYTTNTFNDLVLKLLQISYTLGGGIAITKYLEIVLALLQ